MRYNIFSYNRQTLATLLVGALAGAGLASCSEDTYTPDPDRGWESTTDVFVPTDETGFSTYYNPAIGTCGDPMPYYDQKSGEFRILYLQEFAQNTESYHPMWLLSTKDCANYTNLGEVLPAGAAAEQDAGVGTGCCVYDAEQETYYIYYTGHNAACPQTEAVMRATSTDGLHYKKDMVWILKGAEYGLSDTDFRDPQIFAGDDNRWHMVVSGKLQFAEFVSDNLQDWTLAESFGMPWGRMSECPDVFKMGDWWYMILSDQDKYGRCIKYFKGRTWAELKNAVKNAWFPNADEGKLDSRGYFAAKTAGNGQDRYIWGWCPIRYGADIYAKNTSVRDDVEPAWAGALVCHRIAQKEDGQLAFVPVPGIASKYGKSVQPVVVEQTEGADFDGMNGRISGFGMVRFSRLGYHNHISMTVKTRNAGDKFAFCFVRGEHKDGEENKWFQMGFNNQHWESGKSNLCRVEFKLEGNDAEGRYFDQFVNGALSNFVPRPADNTYNIDIFTDNSVVVVYYNNVLSYTTRIYGIQKNGWSINSLGGEIEVSDLKVTQY